MPGFITVIASALGLHPLRLILYGAVALAAITGVLTIRQHYINKGYAGAIAAVKKQDDRAMAAAEKVERKTAVCTEANGYWDVITQDCKLEDEQ